MKENYNRTVEFDCEWEQQKRYDDFLDSLYNVAEKNQEEFSMEELGISDVEEAIFNLKTACQEIDFLMYQDSIANLAVMDRHLINVIGTLDTLKIDRYVQIKNEINNCIEVAEQMRINTQEKLLESLGMPKEILSRLILNGYEIETSEDLVAYVEQYGVSTLIRDAAKSKYDEKG